MRKWTAKAQGFHELMGRWREHPAAFVREALGVVPDDWQEKALEAFPHHQRIALKSNKGPGKSTFDAWCAWNFLLTRPHPKIAATSISGDNLKDGLWAEMAKWQARSPLLKAAFTWSAERIWANDHRETWWMSARQWPKSADPSQQADTLAGFHADYLLFILDEVGGIPDTVMAAAEAALASGKETKLLISGNPTVPSGPLYRAFTTERHLWHLIEVTGDPDDPNRSPRVSVQWAREQIEKYGRDSPFVLVNVFGQFPPTASNALLGIEVVSQAAKRGLLQADYIYSPKVMGVDIARHGDDSSVIFFRQGKAAMKPMVFRDLDTMQMAGQVARCIDDWKPDGVFIDQTGVGAGVVDRLREIGHEVVGIEFAEKALRPLPKMNNRRTEMWWLMAEWIKGGGCIPNDPELIRELTAPTYRFDSSGRLALESKEDIKKRGLASPDKADALALTFALPAAHKRTAPGPFAQESQRQTAVYEYDPFAEGRQ